MMVISNKVKCLNCGAELVSKSRWDYVSCGCKNNTFTDGGHDYVRCGGANLALVENQSVYSDAPFEIIRENLFRGGRGKSGTEKLKYTKLSEMDDDWLENCIIYEQELRPENRFLPFYIQEKEWRKN